MRSFDSLRSDVSFVMCMRQAAPLASCRKKLPDPFPVVVWFVGWPSVRETDKRRGTSQVALSSAVHTEYMFFARPSHPARQANVACCPDVRSTDDGSPFSLKCCPQPCSRVFVPFQQSLRMSLCFTPPQRCTRRFFRKHHCQCQQACKSKGTVVPGYPGIANAGSCKANSHMTTAEMDFRLLQIATCCPLFRLPGAMCAIPSNGAGEFMGARRVQSAKHGW